MAVYELFICVYRNYFRKEHIMSSQPQYAVDPAFDVDGTFFDHGRANL
ncbi:hypothetical protein SDC9_189689 [bioreactor metagenome]|uniref:Uncharacterized protein n=1 Tax=bioreactor metagenome TaxID=1076179 RepID=A0A645I3T0_9ZZZZ